MKLTAARGQWSQARLRTPIGGSLKHSRCWGNLNASARPGGPPRRPVPPAPSPNASENAAEADEMPKGACLRIGDSAHWHPRGIVRRLGLALVIEKAWSSAQDKLAKLTPGAVHIVAKRNSQAGHRPGEAGGAGGPRRARASLNGTCPWPWQPRTPDASAVSARSVRLYKERHRMSLVPRRVRGARWSGSIRLGLRANALRRRPDFVGYGPEPLRPRRGGGESRPAGLRSRAGARRSPDKTGPAGRRPGGRGGVRKGHAL